MKPYLYKLDGHKTVLVDNVIEWATAFENGAARSVGQNIKGKITVSTVFLGVPKNFLSPGKPLLFETMVFGGPYDGQQTHYHTWDEAEAGHKRIVRKVLGDDEKTS